MTTSFFYRPQSPCILRRSCILHSVFLQEPLQLRAHSAGSGRQTRLAGISAVLLKTGRPPAFFLSAKSPFFGRAINIIDSIILDYNRLSTFSTGFSTVPFSFCFSGFQEFYENVPNPQSAVLHMENLNFTLHNFFKFSIST